MPPVVAAVAAIAAWVAANAVVIMAVMTIAAIGMMAYTIASMPGTASNELKGRQQTVRSAVSPHRVIFGEVVVGGTLIYVVSYGDNNKYVYLAIALAGHQVEEIGDVWIGDKLTTDGTFAGTVRNSRWYIPGGGAVTVNDDLKDYIPETLTITSLTTGVVSPSLYTVDSFNWTIHFDPSLVGQTVTVHYETSWVKIIKHLGADDQEADAELISASNGLWTSAHRLRGVAYIIARLKYDPNVFPMGLPNIKARVKGYNQIYDPRTGLTGYSNNWALCVLAYLTAPFGLGCGLDETDAAASFIAAANISDETVQIKTGTGTGYTTDAAGYEQGRTVIHLIAGTGTILAGDVVTIDGHDYLVKYSLDSAGYLTLDTGLVDALSATTHTVTVAAVNDEKRYTCNGTFTLDMKPVDIMQRLLSAGMGKLVWQQGKYIIKAGAYSSPVGALNESDLRGKITVQTKQSKQHRFNGVKGTFSDPLKNWQPSDFPLVTNALYVSEDNGEEIYHDIELAFTTSNHASQRIAKIMLEKNRQGITLNFPAKFTAFRYAVGDVLQVSISRLGWVNKEFEVLGWTLAKDGAGVDLTLQEEAAGCYDWNYGEATVVDLAPDTQLPNPWVVAAPTGLALTEELYWGNSKGDIKTRGTLTWAGADGMAQRYRVALDGVAVGETIDAQWSFNDLSTQVYSFSVAAVNALGVASPYTTLNYRVLGKSAPPPACSAFLVNRQPDGTREFTWTINAPLDLAGYRIRYVAGTSGTWESMLPLHEGLLTSSPYETNQLPAGDYVFAIVSEDTTGNQSPAVYIETTLDDPRLADVIIDRYPDKLGWPGTLGNCYLDELGQLVAVDTKTWADFATDVVTWADWTAWARAPYTPITYTDEVIDLGVAAPFTPIVSVIASGTVTVEMQTSDDGATWSGWGALGFTIHRYVQFRFTVANASGLAVIKAATIFLSGKPVVTEIGDLVTSGLAGGNRIGTGDIRLPVSGKYVKINTVLLTLQSVGAGWSYTLIDKDTTVGPRVKIYNASGVLADATIDAYIKGL